eukprot:3479545-Amphidinium_carterae.1
MAHLPRRATITARTTCTTGNNKSEASAGPTTTFKIWSAEVTTYICLEKPRLQDTLEHVKQQTIPICRKQTSRRQTII